MTIKKQKKIEAYQVVKALGNKSRYSIVKMLLTGELNVTDINAGLKLTQPAVSQHLMKLRSVSLVVTRREQRNIFYKLKDAKGTAHILKQIELMVGA